MDARDCGGCGYKLDVGWVRIVASVIKDRHQWVGTVVGVVSNKCWLVWLRMDIGGCGCQFHRHAIPVKHSGQDVRLNSLRKC